MRKILTAALFALTFHSAAVLAQQVQWCAVTTSGQVVFCFPTKEACTAMKVGTQTCVPMPISK